MDQIAPTEDTAAPNEPFEDRSKGYYLDSFLAPLAGVLSRDDVTDIYINRPNEIWVEAVGGEITRHDVQGLTEADLARLSRQIAAASAQGINRNHPLLAANLPDGSRVQIVAPPATRAGHAIAIRRHVVSRFSLSDWAEDGAFEHLGKSVKLERLPPRTHRTLDGEEAETYLRQAVLGRKNILVAGGTSTGKTTFLNALLAEIPKSERLILIEDSEELQIAHENAVGLISVRGRLGESDASAEDLLIAALRMRPDRIILGELRGIEAFTFMRAINTGHPGSITTIHADTPFRAIEQLVLLVVQASNLKRDDARHYILQSVDVFVQLERRDGQRRVAQIMVAE
ncbi:P-type DNA transfer ATPase VirB11 [Qipengyuania sp. DSG2-2]|uniref:P-type DNA transfer ATPase VirB11 n=1 Tax=Qipengyuania sp. DGS2-2 TaxID=3349631 RepID=UPI0036D2DF94